MRRRASQLKTFARAGSRRATLMLACVASVLVVAGCNDDWEKDGPDIKVTGPASVSKSKPGTFRIKDQGFGLGPKAPCPEKVIWEFKAGESQANASATDSKPSTHRLPDGTCVASGFAKYSPAYAPGLKASDYKVTVNVELRAASPPNGLPVWSAGGTAHTTIRPSAVKYAKWANDIHPKAAPSSGGPEGVAVMSSGNVLVTDTPNNAIQTFTPGSSTSPSTATSPFASSYDDGGFFSSPRQAVQVSDNEVDVSDSFNGQVDRIKISDGSSSGILDPAPKSMTTPRGIAVSDDRSLVAVADVGDGNPGTGTVDIWGTSPSWPTFKHQITGLHQDEGVAFDNQGNVWVANTADANIAEYSAAGFPAPGTPWNGSVALSAAGEVPLQRPTGIAIDPSDNVWVADWGSGRVIEFNPTGTKVLRVIRDASSASDTIGSPVTLAFDRNKASAHYGDLYIADTSHDRVVHFARTPVQAAGVRAGAASAPVGAARHRGLTLKGKLHASIAKHASAPHISNGPQGSIKVSGAELTGTLALKLKGSAKALKRVPAAAGELLDSKFRASLSGLRVLDLQDHNPLLAKGLMAARSSSGDLGCLRLSPTGTGPLWKRVVKVKLIGGTGQLGNLKFTATMSGIPTRPPGSPKFLSVKVGQSGKSHGVGPCAALASKLG